VTILPKQHFAPILVRGRL